jgi:tetratricopeptide (TPR) repeat protein
MTTTIAFPEIRQVVVDAAAEAIVEYFRPIAALAQWLSAFAERVATFLVPSRIASAETTESLVLDLLQTARRPEPQPVYRAEVSAAWAQTARAPLVRAEALSEIALSLAELQGRKRPIMALYWLAVRGREQSQERVVTRLAAAAALSSLHYHRRARRLLGEVLSSSSAAGDVEGTIAACLHLGRVYSTMSHWDEAANWFRRAAHMAEGRGGFSEFAVYSDLALLHTQTLRMDSAHEYYRRALDVIRRHPSPSPLPLLRDRLRIVSMLAALRARLGEPADLELSDLLDLVLRQP